MIKVLWKKTQLDELIDYFKFGDFKDIHNLDDRQFGEVTCLLTLNINEYVTILEEEYGTNRFNTIEEVESNLGGYILYIDEDNGLEHYLNIKEKYHLSDDDAELEEVIKVKTIENEEVAWNIILYCLNDFNLVIILKD